MQTLDMPTYLGPRPAPRRLIENRKRGPLQMQGLGWAECAHMIIVFFARPPCSQTLDLQNFVDFGFSGVFS
jgi:hypothetical protein